ncbi:S1C family serine protease [Aurantibacillus circumpalustris]|uniref:S1C family serine protease n=1 Tax=Aurantibacillus circumpalustris TaxID=3036359 RepID=UPI00295C20D2|nr:serine protease [Aurantibacillus circumpalustris]
MRVTDLFDNYLNKTLSEEERTNFEKLLHTDVIMASAFNEHKAIIDALKLNSDRISLKKKLKSIHQEEFGNSKVISIHREENFARRHGRTIAVAASTTLIAVLSTVAVLSTGGYLLKQQSNQITDLNRVVMELKASSDGVVEGITKSGKKINYAPANLEGSAFALNDKGYILTSYHMVKGADSIFVRNGVIDRALTKLVLFDPKLDLAVLKLENKDFYKNWQVPFSLNEKSTDVGDKVFTLGYPRKDMVYGEGSLSSLSGYSNDTNMYQISIPVNPGNSGGPLLDENGNVIGVIKGKLAGEEATGFAIKANNILNSIKSCEIDSTKQDLLTQNSKKTSLKKLKRSEQIKRINPYVFNVLVYKRD